jgi:hypothetical protein
MAGINAVQQLILAIDLCLEKGLTAPVLALVHVGIDTMAWLGLPDDQHDVTGEDFMQWVDTYLLPESGISCSALDLYSARCGVLHSMTGESRAIRRRTAKRLFYAWGNRNAEDLQRMVDLLDEPIVAVQMETLVSAFRTAIDRFVAANERDRGLRERVGARMGKVFENTQLSGVPAISNG